MGHIFFRQQVLASYEAHLSVLTGALAVWVQDMGDIPHHLLSVISEIEWP